jgi:hypothetical protein
MNYKFAQISKYRFYRFLLESEHSDNIVFSVKDTGSYTLRPFQKAFLHHHKPYFVNVYFFSGQ